MSTPKFSFCGYPVPRHSAALSYDNPLDWKACGNIATPGCCYCDEHANAVVHDLPSNEVAIPIPLTEEEIIDRHVAAREKNYGRVDAVIGWTTIFIFVVLLAITEPIHAWLHVHLQVLFGMLAGAVVEGIAWAVWRWRKGDRP